MIETSILDLVRTGDQLDAKVFPPLQWAIPGLVPEGLGLLTGAPKIGKSWLVLGTALALATGGSALGKLPVGRPRPVLYLALEDGERRLQARCRQLLGEDAPIPRNFQYRTEVTGPNQAFDLMAAWLDAQGDDASPVAVLDTLGRVMPQKLPGESPYDRDYRIGAQLKRLADDHPGSTVLVVHHVRKAQTEDWMESTSGTNGLNGAADFTLNLSRKRGEDEGLINITGRDVSDGQYAVTAAGGHWALTGDDLADAAAAAEERQATSNLGDLQAAVLRYVNQHPEGVRAGQVVAAVPGFTGDNATRNAGGYLKRLSDSERITKISTGLYGPTVKGVKPVIDQTVDPKDFDTVDTIDGQSLDKGSPKGFDTVDGIDGQFLGDRAHRAPTEPRVRPATERNTCPDCGRNTAATPGAATCARHHTRWRQTEDQGGAA